MPPTPTLPFTMPGFLSTIAYEASQGGARAAADAAFICCPFTSSEAGPQPTPQELTQMPLLEMQRDLEQMSLTQRDQLPPAQLQHLAESAAAQVRQQVGPMRPHRMTDEDPERPVEPDVVDDDRGLRPPMRTGYTDRLIDPGEEI